MKITDEYVLKTIFVGKRQMNISRIKEKYPEIIQYVQNRYNNSLSFSETIYRIKNHIEIRPVCECCNSPVKYLSINRGFRQYCSRECMNSSPKRIEKIQQTNIKKYGNISPLGNKEIQEKSKHTSLLKYGTEYPNQAKCVKDKINESFHKNYTKEQIKILTNIRIQTARKNNSYQKANEKRKITKNEKYGNPNFTNFQKAKQTYMKKYGVDNPAKAECIKNKIKNTNIKKYGETSPLKIKEIKKLSYTYQSMHKKYNTHKRNHTFNSSKIEQQFKEYLEQNYPNDFEYQYRSELYPFNCDFYIKSLNLYIEINGSWTHGGHPFNENNQDDINRLNDMKSKNTKYYQNAIYVWTNLDIKKRNTAKENNLNYLEIFSINLNECINQLNNYIKNFKFIQLYNL